MAKIVIFFCMPSQEKSENTRYDYHTEALLGKKQYKT